MQLTSDMIQAGLVSPSMAFHGGDVQQDLLTMAATAASMMMPLSDELILALLPALRDEDIVLAGFRDCMEEAIRYLTQVEAMPEDDPVIVGMKEHLFEHERRLNYNKLLYEFYLNNRSEQQRAKSSSHGSGGGGGGGVDEMGQKGCHPVNLLSGDENDEEDDDDEDEDDDIYDFDEDSEDEEREEPSNHCLCAEERDVFSLFMDAE